MKHVTLLIVFRKAFTLLELLVGIAIIGLLAALLLPVISKGKDAANSATCKNRLRQMGQALQTYVQENSSKYPHYLGPAGPSYGDAVGLGGRAVGLVYWSTKLYPYYPVNWTNTGWHCPGDKGTTRGPVKGAADRLGSYTYNVFGAMTYDYTYAQMHDHFGLGPMIYWSDAPAVREAQVSVPSEMLSIGESRFPNGAHTGGGDVMQCGRLDLAGTSFTARHGKDYNQLFCDGHVLPMNPWVLFNPRNTGAMWNYDHQPHPELWLP